jgi:Ca2+-binding EF-hand superfamily protein
MDKDRDGNITKDELLKYMRSHNIQFDESKLKEDKIKLLDFLQEYKN